MIPSKSPKPESKKQRIQHLEELLGRFVGKIRIDVAGQFNALICSLIVIENASSNGMYRHYDFFDDVSNKLLNKKKAIEARQLEIDFLGKMKVYNKVPRSQAIGHKVNWTKWLQVGK